MVASPVPVDVVFGAGRVLVWSEEGIDTAAHLLDTGQAPAEAGVEAEAAVAGASPRVMVSEKRGWRFDSGS